MDNDNITVKAAVIMAAKQGILLTSKTIRNWCYQRPELAKKVGGRWFVSAEQMQMILDGSRVSGNGGAV